MQNYTNRVKIQVQFAKEYRCQTPVLARIIPNWEILLLWQNTCSTKQTNTSHYYAGIYICF